MNKRATVLRPSYQALSNARATLRDVHEHKTLLLVLIAECQNLLADTTISTYDPRLLEGTCLLVRDAVQSLAKMPLAQRLMRHQFTLQTVTAVEEELVRTSTKLRTSNNEVDIRSLLTMARERDIKAFIAFIDELEASEDENLLDALRTDKFTNQELLVAFSKHEPAEDFDPEPQVTQVKAKVNALISRATSALLDASGNTSPLEVPHWALTSLEVDFDRSEATDGICKGEWSGQVVAVKELFNGSVDSLDEESVLRFKRELEIRSRLTHLHILPFYGASLEAIKPFIVTKLCTHGNVLTYLNMRPQGKRLQILYEIALGLSYLHNQGIAHANLKSANVLIGDDHKALLADFGLSSLSQETETVTETPWIAPERLSSTHTIPADKRSDIYSFGVITWELYASHAASSRRELRERPRGMKNDLVWLLVGLCCEEDPRRRPGVRNLVIKLKALLDQGDEEVPVPSSSSNGTIPNDEVHTSGEYGSGWPAKRDRSVSSSSSGEEGNFRWSGEKEESKTSTRMRFGEAGVFDSNVFRPAYTLTNGSPESEVRDEHDGEEKRQELDEKESEEEMQEMGDEEWSDPDDIEAKPRSRSVSPAEVERKRPAPLNKFASLSLDELESVVCEPGFGLDKVKPLQALGDVALSERGVKDICGRVKLLSKLQRFLAQNGCEAQDDAVLCAVNMAKYGIGQETLMNHPKLFGCLVKILWFGAYNTKLKVVRCVYLIATNVANVEQLMVQPSLLPALSDLLLEGGSEEEKLGGIKCLAAITSIESGQEAVVAETDVVKSVVGLYSHASPEAREFASICLCNVANTSTGETALINEPGLTEVLRGFLDPGSSLIEKERAAKLLALISYSDQGRKRYLGEPRLYAAIIDLLYHPSSEARENAATCLGHLAVSGEGQRKLLAQTKILPQLAKLFSSGSSIREQEAAARLLSRLTCNTEGQRLILGEPVYLEILADLIDDSSLMTQKYAAQCCQNLCRSRRGADALISCAVLLESVKDLVFDGALVAKEGVIGCFKWWIVHECHDQFLLDKVIGTQREEQLLLDVFDLMLRHASPPTQLVTIECLRRLSDSVEWSRMILIRPSLLRVILELVSGENLGTQLEAAWCLANLAKHEVNDINPDSFLLQSAFINAVEEVLIDGTSRIRFYLVSYLHELSKSEVGRDALKVEIQIVSILRSLEFDESLTTDVKVLASQCLEELGVKF